jgi:hypothetical protein
MKLNKREPVAHMAVSPELEVQYLKAKHLGLLDGGNQVTFSNRHPKDMRDDSDRLWAQVMEEENNIIDIAGGHGVPLSSKSGSAVDRSEDYRVDRGRRRSHRRTPSVSPLVPRRI